LVDLRQVAREAGEVIDQAVFALDVGRVLLDAVPEGGVNGFAAGELLDGFAALLAVVVIGHGGARIADEREFVGQELLAGELVDGRDELALGEVAAGAEDDEDAGGG
jgi:hypothetical protein